MNKGIFAVLALFLSVSLFAQESDAELLSLQRNFAKADLAGKLATLERSSGSGRSDFGPLYLQALEFALRNVDLLKDETLLADIAAAAASSVAASGRPEAVPVLRRVIMAFRETPVRVASLKAIALLGKGDSQVVETLNQFLANQNNLYRTGLDPDGTTLSACIDALAVLGDSSSYPGLFATMIADYPQDIRSRAAEALRRIRGDYKKFLIDIVRKNPPAEKLVAFRIGMENDAFSPAERGELAEAALDISLGLIPARKDEADAISEMRYSAVRELTALRWSRATTLAVKNFYRVQTDYGKDAALKKRFIESIACLGAMASSEAAQALSLQLGFINADMERSKTFDQEVLLAAITALGDLGDKVAFDYLLYIGYLPYPDDVKAAAREALNRLKW